MNMGTDEDEGLTLIELRERLVDTDLLEKIFACRRALDDFEDERNEVIRKARTEGSPHEEKVLEIEQEKDRVRQKIRTVSPQIMEQFIAGLSKCQVRAREGKLTAPYVDIPKSALPTLGPEEPFRLQITNLALSRMAWRKSRHETIIYYDVRVWLPDLKPDCPKPRRRSISVSELRAFLEGHTTPLAPGDEQLTEGALFAAAKSQFMDRIVSRSQIREWIQREMPEQKRFRQGMKPTRPTP